jgi:hypothetical protein
MESKTPTLEGRRGLRYKWDWMRVQRQIVRIVCDGTILCVLAMMMLGAGHANAQTGGTGGAAPPEKSGAQDKRETKSATRSTTRLRIVVTGNDKPVGNASVYVKYNEPGGLFRRDKLAEMGFKTNLDGSVKVPEVPRGKILIQVIAKGWHTYGKWYEVETESETIQIKLEPPPHWY